MYFNRTLSFMQNVFSAANLKNISALFGDGDSDGSQGEGEVLNLAHSVFKSLPQDQS